MTAPFKEVKQKRILVIDDDEMMRSAICATLKASNYVVDESADGQQGLAQARSLIPDLIVCDINMPKLDGFGLLQELRKSDVTSNIPFIFLSGQSDRADMRKGMMLGADDYLTKPFSADELLRVVELRLKKKDALEQQMQTRLEELRQSISLALPHEFRTPLTGILGFAEMLKDGQVLSQEEMAYVGSHIHGSAKRLQHLLENMLLMADLDVRAADAQTAAKLRASVTPVGIVVSQVVEALARESGRKGDARIVIEDSRANILEPHLSKAIEELVLNALKFSDKGTVVSVSTSAEKDHAVIVVEDRGKGMTAEQVQRVGAYVQFDRASREQQGSGLGLALVKKIMQLYNGSMSIESTPSVGTKVSVRLPRAH